MYDRSEESEAGYYFTGDGCRRDEDGFYWITGRVDDVLNISGHRIGTAEVESAIVAAESTAEAAVVGFPPEIKGQAICCYVILKAGVEPRLDPPTSQLRPKADVFCLGHVTWALLDSRFRMLRLFPSDLA